jgi:hypothetical protein
MLFNLEELFVKWETSVGRLAVAANFQRDKTYSRCRDIVIANSITRNVKLEIKIKMCILARDKIRRLKSSHK